MVDAGSTLPLMGNHEFHAIAWITPDPDHPGELLLPRESALGGPKTEADQLAWRPTSGVSTRFLAGQPGAAAEAHFEMVFMADAQDNG